jgi:hypothetical protein
MTGDTGVMPFHEIHLDLQDLHQPLLLIHEKMVDLLDDRLPNDFR